MSRRPPPPIWLATLVVVILAAVWGYIRLLVFRESILPLTFVLPMLVCVWTRRTWHVVAMASAFMAMASYKLSMMLKSGSLPPEDVWTYYLAIMLNVSIGAVVIYIIILSRNRVEAFNDKILEQNTELESQAEELSQQNEEIRSQSEELAQQNEEIESQTEEARRQNEELQEYVERLRTREEMLQMIVRAAGSTEARSEVLREVCQRGLGIIGAPADAVVVLELKDYTLQLRAVAGASEDLHLPPQWPLHGSLAAIVLNEGRTACVDDIRQRPDLAAPFGSNNSVRSILAAPIQGKPGGVLVVVSRTAVHWSEEQFQLTAWVAAQCGLILESLAHQDSLAERSRRLEVASRAKDQFLAMLSHELRTPLTPVLAAAGALATDVRIPADAREDLLMIRRNVNVQSRLIDDLLDLTRLERGKLDMHKQVLSVASVLREAAGIVAADVDAKEQSLRLNLDVPDTAAVLGDGARLQQVFWNLMKNASKFSPPRSKIAMTARVENIDRPWVVIEVIDEGAGIAREDLDRIFLPFEQAISSRQHLNNGGLGLGLAIAKAIVERHDGKISATSKGVEQGATFTVRLPLTGAPVATVPSTDDDAGTETGRLSRILLVEDHLDTGHLLARLLRNSGYTVEHADSVNAALRMLTENTFDLLISDLGLPDGSGFDLMRKVHELYPDLPAICLSGYGMEADIAESKEAGFAEHLTKPVDLQQLHAAVGRVLGRADSMAF